MAKKKITQVSVSQADNVQAQPIFEQYHQLAAHLHECKDRQELEAALTAVNKLPEAAQIALLKTLAKEHHSDAADILTVLHELSPMKNVRKEARRALIQLEGAKIHAAWVPPIDRISPIAAVQPTTHPPRFWKGLVTDTVEEGVIQLLLSWEQGIEYHEVRTLGFLLDFNREGVKDFFTQIETKRSHERFIADVLTGMKNVTWKPCSLARGHHLLQRALAVHQKRGTLPHKDYQLETSLITHLIFNASDLDTEDYEKREHIQHIDLSTLTPMLVVRHFVEACCVRDDYDLAYDLLSKDSPLRTGLTKGQWIARRETWNEQGDPRDLTPCFIYEPEPHMKLWVPPTWSAAHATTHKEVEAGWSIILDDTPLSETLPELPRVTAIYPGTRRHWFWASYTLIQEDGHWCIQSMTDESIKAQGLSIDELQRAIEEIDAFVAEFKQKYDPGMLKADDEETAKAFLSTIRFIMLASYYTDILLRKLPLDRSLYEDAAGRLLTFNQYERALVYLSQMVERFPQQGETTLRTIARLLRLLSEQYHVEYEDEERAEHFDQLAVQALEKSLTGEASFDAHISLAEIFIKHDERLDEAELHLLKAKTLAADAEDEAHAEMHLGEIATENEDFDKALSHYQRVVELQPTSAESWIDQGEAYEMIDQSEEAEASYKRAISLEPDNTHYYHRLSNFYLEHEQPARAISALERGLINNPDSSVLHLYLSAVYMDIGDVKEADIFLRRAERIDPESELVHMYRKKFEEEKTKQVYSTGTRSKERRRR